MESCTLFVLYFKNLSHYNIISRKSLILGPVCKKKGTTRPWSAILDSQVPTAALWIGWISYLLLLVLYSLPSCCLRNQFENRCLTCPAEFGSLEPSSFSFSPLTFMAQFIISFRPKLVSFLMFPVHAYFWRFFVWNHHACEENPSSPYESDCYCASTANAPGAGDSHLSEPRPER